MDTNNIYGTLEIQHSLLSLLKEFDRLCRRNNINYSLAFGSLLGAVRHKGFIPWDDDIDIMVDRNNYKRLISAITNETLFHISRVLWIDRIQLANHSDNATIDVFILDNTPNNRLIRKVHQIMLLFIQGTLKNKPNLSNKSFGASILLCITYFVGLFFSNSFKNNLYQKVSQLFSKNKTNSIACYNVEYLYFKKIFPNNINSEYIRLPFESIDVSCISGFDTYLSTLYGNYMILPAEKDRIPKHGYIKNKL